MLPPAALLSMLLGICLLVAETPAGAQATASAQGTASAVEKPAVRLPAWVVLALQPVSGDRVRPVTGVVISGDGLVVVPLEFAEAGNQMIVLDGGVDIIRNGRAAVLKQRFPQLGLAVISAPALHRSAATFSASPPLSGDTIHLAAFPPAEQISQGMAPLWEVAELILNPALAVPGVAVQPGIAVAGLPNVTGPLLDACGNFAGFSSAEGVQSMETNKSPTYVWKDSLQRLLAGMSLTLAEGPCPIVTARADEAKATATAPAETMPPDAGAADENPVADTPPGNQPGSGESSTSASGGLAVVIPQWLYWLVGTCLLLILVLVGMVWWLHRIRVAVQLPSLLHDSRSGTNGRRRAVASSNDEPAPTADCELELIGRLPNGTAFTQRCEVSAAAVSAVIGRGPVDLVIDSQAVHREHARLGGSVELLTISDLGSPQGTWINRVPCLKGEIMFITPEDTIFLGDVSFQVMVRPGKPAGRAGDLRH